jgi:hypothetical protein
MASGLRAAMAPIPTNVAIVGIAKISWPIGIEPKTGMTLIGDGGIIFGNQGGTRPEVSINNDLPSEVRIHPNQ